MKKWIAILICLFVLPVCYGRTQRYQDCFEIVNDTDKNLYISFSFSELVIPTFIGNTQYGFLLDLRDIQIELSSSGMNIISGQIPPYGYSDFTYYAYDDLKFHKMDWFSKFLLISGYLVISDDNGDVILTLDELNKESFIITQENGCTTATLYISRL